MKDKKIFFLTWFLAFFLISALCIFDRQPLLFHPIDYGFGQSTLLFVLLGALSFGLLGVLDILKKIQGKFFQSFSQQGIYAYYLIGTVSGLFILTLFSGFAESFRPFFYYSCVTNSCIYLFSGYLVTILATILFAREQLKQNNN